MSRTKTAASALADGVHWDNHTIWFWATEGHGASRQPIPSVRPQRQRSAAYHVALAPGLSLQSDC